MSDSALVEARGISKSFGAVRALSEVSFDLRAGEVHALVGENGAGKSTFIKIVTGAERADAGTLVIAGTPVPHLDPHTAHALGIAAIYQQPSLFPDLTVAENIALALETCGPWRRLNWRERTRRAGALHDPATDGSYRPPPPTSGASAPAASLSGVWPVESE